MMDHTHRKIPLYKLVALGSMLERFESFAEPPARCNFSVRAGMGGWSGKNYVDKHDVAEYQPDVRGDMMANLYHIRIEDYVILTVNQYKDYTAITDSD